MKTNQTFSLLFWLNSSLMKNGLAPLYVRLTVNGKRAEISLKRSIAQARWLNKAQMAKGNSEEARTLNAYLNLVRGQLEKHYNRLLAAETEITAELLKNAYLGVSEEKKTFLEVFRYHNRLSEGKIHTDYALNTLKKYRVTLNKVTAFLKHHYRQSDVFLSELNHQFLTEFEYFLKTQHRLDHNSAMAYIKITKKVVRFAMAHEWLSKDPFQHFKCSTREVIREYLSQEELDRVAAKRFSTPRLEEVRDLFLFSCYTGYSYADVVKLSSQHLLKGIDGEQWIITNRSKTESKSNVPLLPAALELIDRYRQHPECRVKDTLFPVKSNQKLNAYLKEIADVCGISKKLTFHIARHTFATTLTLTNGVPIESVSSMLGHKNIRTTQIYAKVVERKVSEDMKALREKLGSQAKLSAKDRSAAG